jgi:hypothetical protein
MEVREIEYWTFFDFREFGGGNEDGAYNLSNHFTVFHVPMRCLVAEYCPVGELLTTREDMQDRM